MRTGLALAVVVAVLAPAWAASAATYVYVGNAGSSEIVVLSLDPKDKGYLKIVDRVAVPRVVTAGGSTPLAISPSKKFLYVGLRGEPKVAASFEINRKSGRLTYLGAAPLPDSMAYIAIAKAAAFC